MNFDAAPELPAAEALIRVIEADARLTREPQVRVVHAWFQAVRSQPALEQDLWNRLHARLDCLTTLARRIETSGARFDPGSPVLHWIEGVRLAESWSAQPGTIELQVPGDSSGSTTPAAVLCATVWSLLNELEDVVTVTPALREAIESCANRSRAWCLSLPVPPAPGRSWDPETYVDRRALCQVAPTLLEELQQWDDMLLEDYLDADETPPPGFNLARFGNARDVLVATCEELNRGWAVEQSRVQAALDATLTALPDSEDSSTLGNALNPLRSELETFGSALQVSAFSAPVAAPKATRVRATLQCADPGYLGRLSQAARWARQPGQAVPEDWQDGLELLLQKMDGLSEQAAGRELLNLLVDLDARVVPGETPRPCLAFRDQLRQVLIESFPYQVLDTGLVGRRFDEVRDSARVRRTLPVGSPGQILFVARPGYVYQFADGRKILIRPAEVDISG